MAIFALNIMVNFMMTFKDKLSLKESQFSAENEPVYGCICSNFSREWAEFVGSCSRFVLYCLYFSEAVSASALLDSLQSLKIKIYFFLF